MAIDPTRYIELRNTGAVTVTRYANGTVVRVRQYDPATGAELMPVDVPVGLDGLRQSAEQNRRAAENLDALIADIEALG